MPWPALFPFLMSPSHLGPLDSEAYESRYRTEASYCSSASCGRRGSSQSPVSSQRRNLSDLAQVQRSLPVAQLAQSTAVGQVVTPIPVQVSSTYPTTPSQQAKARKLMTEVVKAADACRTPTQRVQKNTGKSRICGRNRSKGLCYAGVKDALLAAGITSTRLPGTYAIEAHSKGYLRRTGKFDQILESQVRSQPAQAIEQAPPGAILVYSGGPDGYGHIEVKVNTGEQAQFCSDFCSRNPVRGRQLVAIYYPKP